jgi:hypothetical protein
MRLKGQFALVPSASRRQPADRAAPGAGGSDRSAGGAHAKIRTRRLSRLDRGEIIDHATGYVGFPAAASARNAAVKAWEEAKLLQRKELFG